jgi:glucose/arabinose dehydrogenase
VISLSKQRAGAAGASANRITLRRDSRVQGLADQRFVLLEGVAHGLNSPLGMAWRNGSMYVVNIDAVMRFPDAMGKTKIAPGGEKLAELPAGPINHHWTKNLVADDGNVVWRVSARR